MNLDIVLSLLARDASAAFDVADVALHLARDEYPELDIEAYQSELASMSHEARAYVRGDLKARVLGLCRYLFYEMGFRGNTRVYYDPRNSYLNQVLDRRTGIPITLSVLTMAIGKRAGLEVVGVGLPGHFVAKAIAGDREIVFDPFHGGRLLTLQDCQNLVEQATGTRFPVSSADLQPLPLGKLVQRMLTNLKAIYFRGGDFSRAVRTIERLRQLNPHDPWQQRDLGISLLRAGKPGRAIDHLSAYLDSLPDADDAETIQQLLGRARGSVARWN